MLFNLQNLLKSINLVMNHHSLTRRSNGTGKSLAPFACSLAKTLGIRVTHEK